jgi:hypothetical protein
MTVSLVGLVWLSPAASAELVYALLAPQAVGHVPKIPVGPAGLCVFEGLLLVNICGVASWLPGWALLAV